MNDLLIKNVKQFLDGLDKTQDMKSLESVINTYLTGVRDGVNSGLSAKDLKNYAATMQDVLTEVSKFICDVCDEKGVENEM